MASFFGQRGTTQQPNPPATSLRIQSAVQGKPRAIGWGQGRLAGNLIWYGDFKAIPHYNASGGGGKGVGAGGGGKGAQGNVSYTYQTAVVIALCEGPIGEVLSVWNNKSNQSLGMLNMTPYPGTYDQVAWPYLSSLHPADALNFRGTSYVASGPLDLGDSQELPNFSYEVRFGISNAIPGLPDADPRDVIIDAMTNPHYGVDYPADKIGPLAVYSSYCRATGMVVSPIITDQQQMSKLVQDMLAGTNSEAVMSGGVLDIVPRGDQSVAANGAIYTAPAAPEYDLTDDDFLRDPSSSDPPIRITRAAQQDKPNIVSVEYLDRANSYNPVLIDAKDDASIASFGERPAVQEQRHFFANGNAAQMSAYLQLGRLQLGLKFEFTLPPRFIRLDPMDIVTLTRASQGMFRQWVRIVEITENDDHSLAIVAEEYLGGTGAAPIYGQQASNGYVPDYQADPGGVNAPVLFEPTDQLAGGLEVWGAVSGAGTPLWGGADIYVSYDNETYQFAGRTLGGSRTGVLSAPLASVTPNPTGITIDTTSVASVDTSQSRGALLGGSDADLLAFNTLCYVGGEFFAYRDATLTDQYKYNLSYLARGVYGTESLIAMHPTGTPFCRVDNSLIKIPFDQSRIGATIYVKICSFNVWGGGLQQISDVAPYTYQITGSALKSPLPDVQNLTDTYVDGVLTLAWDKVEDFRQAIFYEVRVGDTPDSALTLGNVGTPKFPVPGDGKYWVSAWCQPTPDLIVRSENWVSRTVQGAVLVRNVIATVDEKAAGWTGIFSGGAGPFGADIATGGAGDLLAETDFLGVSDILSFGGNVSGFYETASANWVDLGRVIACPVKISWVGTGEPVGANILGETDILGLPDFLGSYSTQFVDVYPVVSVAQNDARDLYSVDPSDLYYYDNLYAAGLPWGPWERYVPGDYSGKWIRWGMVLQTIDPATRAICQAFKIEIDVPDRVDTTGLVGGVLTSLVNATVPAGGLTITFAPTGSSTPAPFNGAPDGTVGGLPGIQVTCGSLQSGDRLLITGLTASGVTVAYKDSGGADVTRTGVNIYAQGF